MNRLELLYGYQKTESGLKVYADMHHVNQNTMTRWIRQFLLHGLAGVRHRSLNHRYLLNTKIEAVKEYQAGFPGEKIIEKYDIRSLSQLKQWSIQYNNDELKTKSRKRVRKMGRKVSFEEKCKIVQWVLDHDNDYQGATIQFNVSYQRVYSWVHKYHEAADSWEALKDNRGHRKPQKALEEMTEKERLEAEIKRLKKINREMELEIAFAKKLVEIRNRGVKRPDDIKRFKN
ncbi:MULTISPECIES: helix-turn-helix domain-containing protein [Limosilactobacillus]|uniref:COG2963 n=8 Tax=Limosilactobacillus fermentum TaxID=1613 RepID=A0ABF7R478_LIMF3|nr:MULTISPECIES: helix-turn-helix domain-containing protein [Limosilactobacillus]EQC59012.1 transposase [Limosilactobacillus fermentum MTCC 8711]AWV30870.1 helix-turn-helix domain-containing protein [Limosilactobacillus fermentum]EQC59224.1 transposase [Limosilactobacillus fermentum MTCC 8711]EQC59588.1 transposase [Limosilactobacillus fermentum MTCC 8711]MCH5382624.1 helix-turn-helix domain-containing protein [Limosilactobacillus fermentum]